MYAEYAPAPFLSILIDDCIANGRDYNDGGARYNTSYIQGVGIGSLTDSFAALKRHVFETATLGMNDFLDALKADFAGRDALRTTLLSRSPKYGNDDDYADDVMRSCFDVFLRTVEGRSNTKGGTYHIDMLPTTCHVYFGSVTGAMPDGRKAWTPLSEGISPVQGADRMGPTAVMKSAAKMDHAKTGGTLLNQKFARAVLAGDEGIGKLAHMIRGYFALGGHHVQFNVIDAETLREAQQKPEEYRNLIVRVAGYSDYFVDIGRALQDEIISRTEQQAV
jgi:formate C-acetyltransferase